MATKQNDNSQPKQQAPPQTPATPQESTVKAGRTALVRNLTQAYYGIERKPQAEGKGGKIEMLCPYFEGQGYEELDDNDAVRVAKIPEEEWEWILKTNPTVARDCEADIANGRNAKLMVNFQ